MPAVGAILLCSATRFSSEAAMAGRSRKAIVAYADPLSVCAGDTLNVFVSCDVPGEFTAALVRLDSGDSRPHGTGFREVEVAAAFAGNYPGERQALLPGSYAVVPELPGAGALTFACYFFPTLLGATAQTLVHGGGFAIEVRADGVVIDAADAHFTLAGVVVERRWHRLVVVCGEQVAAQLDVLPRGSAEQPCSWRMLRNGRNAWGFTAGVWEFARRAAGRGHFNGRIEAPRLYRAAVPTAVALGDLDAALPLHPGLTAAWDFSLEIDSHRLVDVSGNAHHGTTCQLPTRAVRGVRWRGDVFDWREDPSQYGAIHFHDDDLVDVAWQPSIRWQVPASLRSGVYAVKLSRGKHEDYVPIFVRPAADHQRAPVVYLAATATYLAYANQRLGFSGGLFPPRKPSNANDRYLCDHPEVGLSLYEYHRDGSGVHFSSRLRPVLNLKPKGTPWSFTADSNITAWLTHIAQPFDVVTDEDLHRDGLDALAPYRVVVTGTHPEYYSTAMLDALDGWLERGGRLMYMGGNGFYWRIAYCPDNPAIIEVRRAEDGTRAWISEPGEYYHAFTGEYGGLWRRLGRPPNELVGVGFAAQGFDGGTHYRLQPGAADPRAAFIMAGVASRDGVIGAHGSQGGGAAGEEIDRYDPALGSPRHALVIASSERHRPGMLRVKEEIHMALPPHADPAVRADMTFFETAAGGAVFSTGSISYAGALASNGYDNDIARLTRNVLERFLDSTPFEFPAVP
jgi:N,N-dimethylformamidase beta subunit-like, C-terminal